MDKFSYSIGLGIGQNLKGMGTADLNVEDFAQAVKDVLTGAEPAISHTEARQIVNEYFEKLEERMNAENMYNTDNQSVSTNWRWRKDGDVTPMPRAMYGSTAAYNYLGSDRYVEDASFVRFQYFQLTYRVPSKLLKPLGLNSLSVYLSGNNLFCWTKYSGTDPEHSVKSYSYAIDESNTPRSKSFTVGLNVSF